MAVHRSVGEATDARIRPEKKVGVPIFRAKSDYLHVVYPELVDCKQTTIRRVGHHCSIERNDGDNQTKVFETGVASRRHSYKYRPTASSCYSQTCRQTIDCWLVSYQLTSTNQCGSTHVSSALGGVEESASKSSPSAPTVTSTAKTPCFEINT